MNVVPAFMPPTFAVLSILAVTYGYPTLELVLVGAAASTIGRYVLARYTGPVADRYLPKKQKKGIKYLRNFLRGERGTLPFIISFLYSLSPLPSNALFIVAGAAHIQLRGILSGFIVGRLISYGVLVSLSRQLVVTSLVSVQYLIVDLIGAGLAIALLFVDWQGVIGNLVEREKKRRTEEGMRTLFR
jgi:membrane protein YqaA with SNARE-associated domain